MPIYFTSQGIAFSENGSEPTVFVRYDSLNRSLSLVDNTSSILLGDLDSPELETIVRNTLGNFAVLTQPVAPVQSIESKIQITNTETDSFVTAGGIEAAYVRVVSDKNAKTDITGLDAQRSVQALRDFSPVLFRYHREKHEKHEKQGKQAVHAGVIAQDLQENELTKNFVSSDQGGRLSVDFISHLYSLISGLRAEVWFLQEEIKKMKGEIKK